MGFSASCNSDIYIYIHTSPATHRQKQTKNNPKRSEIFFFFIQEGKKHKMKQCNPEKLAYYTVSWRRGIVVMDFDCYTGNCGSIPAHGDSLGKWMNLRLGQPMPCEGNWVVSPRCWQVIDIQSVYSCENMLLSLLQFNHMEIENDSLFSSKTFFFTLFLLLLTILHLYIALMMMFISKSFCWIF